MGLKPNSIVVSSSIAQDAKLSKMMMTMIIEIWGTRKIPETVDTQAI